MTGRDVVDRRAGAWVWLDGLSPWRARLLLALSGALGVLALPPFSLAPLFALSLSVLFLRALFRAGDRGWTGMALDFWSWGFGYFLAGLYWIGYSFLVDAATFAWMLPFVAVLMPSGLALFFALAGVVFLLAARRIGTSPLRLAVLFALCLFATEWLRGHILTGFPWNLAGYIWADHLIFAQSARWTGIYGLTLLTLAWALMPGLWVASRGVRTVKGVALAGFLVLPLGLGSDGLLRLNGLDPVREYPDGPVIRLVQPNVPQAEKWRAENRASGFRALLDLTQAAPGYDRVTHVIWPETATPFLLGRDPGAQDMVRETLGPDRVLITGYPRIEAGADRNYLYNAVGLFREGRVMEHAYDKRHLVPFGEYLPLADLLGAIGLKKLTAGREGYSPGAGPLSFPVKGLGLVRPLICYEAIFPGEVLDPDQPGPDLLLNLTNDAWFGDSTGPYQHLAISRMRAIETGLPMIRVANTGISAVFDRYGREIRRLGLNEGGTIDVEIKALGL